MKAGFTVAENENKE